MSTSKRERTFRIGRSLAINVAVLVSLASVLVSCSRGPKQTISVKLQEIQSFGKEEGPEDELIGIPGGIATDSHGKLYVTDNAFKKIKIFSEDGRLVRTMGKGEGRGPGEFLDLRWINVDSSGNVYAVDLKKRDITMFDSIGNIQKTLRTKFEPSYIVAFSPTSVYVSAFPSSLEGDLIYKFDMTLANPEVPGNVFCERYHGPYQWEMEKCGETSVISKGKSGEVLCSLPYPYDLRAFSAEGKLLFNLKRDVDFYKPPYLKRKETGLVMNPSGMKGCALLPNDIVMALLFEINEEEKYMRFYLDFWDAGQKEFLGMVSQDDLGIKLTSFLCTDPMGFLYVYTRDPYPHVTKYKMTLTSRAR